jgi:hypothetical protein
VSRGQPIEVGGPWKWRCESENALDTDLDATPVDAGAGIRVVADGTETHHIDILESRSMERDRHIPRSCRSHVSTAAQLAAQLQGLTRQGTYRRLWEPSEGRRKGGWCGWHHFCSQQERTALPQVDGWHKI